MYARFKKAKTHSRVSRRLLSLTRQIQNHRQPKLQNYYFNKETRTKKDFLEFTLKDDFFSQFVDLLVISSQYVSKSELVATLAE